ncbi:HET-domain-containing protein [Ophiobolus disseminans]|uniref:HET-domain-containing protein n=1 Tax=Ophiobolus disseminans TaxID=1469910 RepID=A0A6A7A882_9PLEO|nr:HET-domain-containing protein [Ophiobolus disseminans]
MSEDAVSRADKLSRRQQAMSDLALLSVATTRAKPGQWKKLKKLPPAELAYYMITCRRCAPDVWASSEPAQLADKSLRIKDLSSTCVCCTIIRQAYIHFVADPNINWINIDHTSISLKSGAMRLSFPRASRRFNNVYICSKERDNPSNPFPCPVQDICLDPSSDALVDKIHRLIKDCAAAHESCAASASMSEIIPERLVKLDGRLQLVHATRLMLYTALSYCWGGHNKHQTLRTNVEAREGSIELSGLPRTLQDAILFTRKLGVEYIWIDSMCIVQDDSAEWARESAKMADIYSKAYVVLAATRANDVTEGFLQHRRDPYNISSCTKAGKVFTVRARDSLHHSVRDTMNFDHLPLSQRGWCLQEGLLATRIVHFLPSEVYFKCKTTEVCECGLAAGNDYMVRAWPPPHNSKIEHPELFMSTMWNMITEDCSRRHFTIPDDVLPALSGLAQRTESLCPGKYIAGMWEFGLVYQLNWFAVANPTTPRSPQKSVTRPTFSWITSPYPIRHAFFNLHTTLVCTLIGTQVTPATTDPFGRLSHASITLRGPVVMGFDLIAALINMKSDLHKPWLEDDLHHAEVNLDLGVTFPDENFTENTRYNGLFSVFDWSLIIGFGTLKDERGFTVMLLLQYNSQDDAYNRVGLVQHIPENWFNSQVTECTVTIV